MHKFTLEELKQYDGSSGKAYVAFRGKVYDVSDSYLWEGGQHQDEHEAGRDLTEEMELNAPHDAEMLDKFEMVGELVEGENPES